MDIPSVVWICLFLCFKFTQVQVRIQEKNPDTKKDRSFCGGKIWYHLQGAPPVDGWWAWLFWPCLSWSMHLSMPRGGGKVGFVWRSKRVAGLSHHDCWKKVGKWNWFLLDDNDSCYTYPLGGLASPCNIRLDGSCPEVQGYWKDSWSKNKGEVSVFPDPPPQQSEESAIQGIQRSQNLPLPQKNDHCQEIASSIHHFSAYVC